MLRKTKPNCYSKQRLSFLPILQYGIHLSTSFYVIRSPGFTIIDEGHMGVSKSFRTDCLGRELQMVWLSDTRRSYVPIL